MKRTFLLCIIFHFFSLAAMDVPWESPYDHQAIGRTRDFIKKSNFIYNPKPTQEEGPFNKEEVLNTPYLQEIVKASQDKKDEASETISRFQFHDITDGWPLERTYLAAAALCGGKKGLDGCLESATRRQDFHLCKLLLEHGAKPGTLLTHVRSVQLAELFIAHKAPLVATNEHIFGLGLLHTVAFSDDYEAGLIPLYRKHGLSPLGKDNPLFSLLHSTDFMPWPHEQEKDILDKAKFLLADLSPVDTINLLFRYPDAYRSHILTQLKHATAAGATTNNKTTKEKLYKILLQAKADAEQKLGKNSFVDGDYYYTKYTDLIGPQPFKEKMVVVHKHEVNPSTAP